MARTSIHFQKLKKQKLRHRKSYRPREVIDLSVGISDHSIGDDSGGESSQHISNPGEPQVTALNASQPVKLQIQNEFVKRWEAAGRPSVVKDIVVALAEEFKVGIFVVYNCTRELRPHKNFYEKGPTLTNINNKQTNITPKWELTIKEAVVVVYAESFMDAVTKPFGAGDSVILVKAGEVIAARPAED